MTDGGSPPGSITRRRIGLATIGVLIVFAGVGAAVWLLQSSDSENAPSGGPSVQDGTGSTTLPGVGAEIVSEPRLRQLATASGHMVYWAGPRSGTRLEYTQIANGTTYVRYLTRSAKAGDPSARYLVVATYSQPDAFKRVSEIAGRQHLFIASLGNGGIAVTRPGRPRNVYVVYPGRPYQVEVYAPSAAEARRVAVSGAIAPVM
jgi:hypothetical protein